ncbi:MAG: argininosuccinate lyase [Sphingobacteriales bacterium 17-39-43]|uniref:argininosuccinate lyase n=1 Tax=Daejeonella sp. TaxID=2805397 RepID=UPI000BDDE7A9|nr:argininosuccinate lyase [Daejeonella sp.]OYY04455.1 MAG: argininosuccinate lyase [Sphingobacteriia bacterium 35-40-5]OYZ28602.1 MAG: argininosuccinate lyase [Sphingobacteriales bacterium 16-39-50]OZA22087.1 MAG: argininosuccinate lyase [Sphingobacteriales bacterium 17-39-43]OZA62192.1 MAG: argininosuccinate lyase [Sphingobacteriales bacterium 39-40-5]HQS50402.1 argininosuccinate lyase [Daejeonella sp.]
MSKLWQKETETERSVEKFTVGNDRELDHQLAAFDVLGSLAHTRMLESVGLMGSRDLEQVQAGLKQIFREVQEGKFSIEDDVEDVHSQVELLLTRRIGDAGKKIHSGRSRNDQVLVDLKLFFRSEIQKLVRNTDILFTQLIAQSEEHKDKLLPGYTHLQIAMPSSFGLWFGAYAESLADDMELMLAAWKVCNKNPLGSAAGYGSSFPLNRTMTTELLGFDSLNYNVVYAQMGRGKTERILAQAMSSLAATLAKLAMDACLFINQNFAFISFPDELTTGSSIMPHKKNPDVFELIRARCNKIQALPNEIALMTTNLPSGYHRDLQLLKENLFPAFRSLNECLEMTGFMLQSIRIKEDILKDEKYAYLFSVDAVNEEVLNGLPFREAYKKVGAAIEKGEFKAPGIVKHTHEGSIGNLCNEQITTSFREILKSFNFEKVDKAVEALIR